MPTLLQITAVPGARKVILYLPSVPGMDRRKGRDSHHSDPRSPSAMYLSISPPASVYLNAGSAT